jgi:predicted RNA-binding protein (virulence factor B family)
MSNRKKTIEMKGSTGQELSASLEIGRVNRLEVYKRSEFGLFLRAGNGEEVLLPNAYVTPEMQVGDRLEVFCYHDSEDRPVATTERPTAMLGGYGIFEVVDYRPYGAFVDWGLPKDLFVPLSQQKEYFRIGEKKLLRICRDEQTGRLYATQKLGKYFVRDMKGLRPGQEVDLMILAKTPLGYKAIVDGKYEGMLFSNEIFEELQIGARRRGYIVKVRPDHKLDLSLRPPGKEAKLQEAQDKILEALREAGGTLPMNYKSSPEEIKARLGLSRKIFKGALSALQEQGRIELLDKGMRLKGEIEG